MGISTWIHTINDQINLGYRYPTNKDDRDFSDVDNFARYLHKSAPELIFESNDEDAQYTSVVLDKDMLMEIFKSIMNKLTNMPLNESLKLLSSYELIGLISDIERLINRCEVFPRFQISWNY